MDEKERKLNEFKQAMIDRGYDEKAIEIGLYGYEIGYIVGTYNEKSRALIEENYSAFI